MAQERLSLNHINIRQSIVILIAKLVVIDIILSFIVIGAYYLIILSRISMDNINTATVYFLVFFVVAGILKIALGCYVVLLWLNEYYEITPEHVTHRKGLIFKKQEQYRIDHIRRIEVEDTFLGELLNYATISIYDIRLNKYLDMVLIHNARRYAKVFQELRPNIEMKEDKVWIPLVKTENNEVEEQ